MSDTTPHSAEFRTVVAAFAHLLSNFGGDLTAALEEGARDCESAGEAFHRIAAANERLRSLAARDADAASARDSCDQIGRALDEAVVALQYQDRLTQRIGHVRGGLRDLQRLLTDGSSRPNEEWLALLFNLEQAHRAELARLVAQKCSKSECELF